MKKFVIILFIYPYFLFSQSDSLTKQFIKDILKSERYISNNQKIKIKLNYSKDSLFYFHFKKTFLENEDLVYTKIQRETYLSDTIKIDRKEKKQILHFLKERKWVDWNKIDTLGFETTNEASWDILSEKFKKYAYLEIYNPIFLRNNTIAVCSEIYLCGQDCGYTYFGFYKKINGIWKQWIPISNGLF